MHQRSSSVLSRSHAILASSAIARKCPLIPLCWMKVTGGFDMKDRRLFIAQTEATLTGVFITFVALQSSPSPFVHRCHEFKVSVTDHLRRSRWSRPELAA